MFWGKNKVKSPAATGNRTQDTWLLQPVLRHWAMTTGQPPSLTILNIYCTGCTEVPQSHTWQPLAFSLSSIFASKHLSLFLTWGKTKHRYTRLKPSSHQFGQSTALWLNSIKEAWRKTWGINSVWFLCRPLWFNYSIEEIGKAAGFFG